MTPTQLDAVPINGKVRGTFDTLTRKDDSLWVAEDDGEVVPHSKLKGIAYALSLVSDPKTWQDTARAQGWFIAEDGRFAGRFFSNSDTVVISEHNGTFWVAGDKASTIELAIEIANGFAAVNGGWA